LFACSAVSVEHRLVTDGRKDGQTDTRQQLMRALASDMGVKINRMNSLDEK